MAVPCVAADVGRGITLGQSAGVYKGRNKTRGHCKEAKQYRRASKMRSSAQ